MSIRLPATLFPVHDRGRSGPGIATGKEGNPGATGTLGKEDNTWSSYLICRDAIYEGLAYTLACDRTHNQVGEA